MRYQGKIAGWKDEQGFGFVTPNGGGERAFVHITNFADRNRRPTEGDIITYEAVRDEKNRLKAEQIRFVRVGAPRSTSSTGDSTPILVAVIFILVLFALAAFNVGHILIPVTYLIMSAITFLAYAFDKSAAKNKQWRTRESTLHMLGLFGGWPGALVAQVTLRHKSSKAEFQTTFIGTVIINLLVLIWFVSSGKAGLVASLS